MYKEGGLSVKLQGKTAIVTGTSPNIGGGIAEVLGEAGAKLVCVDANEANANDCARAIVAAGGEAIGLTCDVTKESEVEKVVKDAVSAFGTIDVLVNNAAIFNKKGVLDMPYQEWQRQIDIILSGTFLFTKHVVHAMIAKGTRGSIINIISTAGHQGEPGNIAYSTAKCGLLNFTRSAAMELAAHGIRVNSLTPTATDPSESYDRAKRWGREVASRASTVMDAFRRRIPMQRLPVPTDYGQAAAFLASDNSKMMTGADLRIDAGAVARYWAWEPAAD
jgi:NAD(P)-dependent dehydrogenase (short-subunit alcohol dehydrogenase family)